MTNNYGQKTWREISFVDLIPGISTNRIIGMTFPRSDISLGLEPSILTLLPQGENVSYDPENRDYNDGDVNYYLCSVYISGYEEFVSWAQKHDSGKIIVGGYHPTTFPEDFVKYAYKIVQGPCDDIFATIEQQGQIVPGITTHQSIPRRDLYDIGMNQQVIPLKHPNDCVVSINTSQGCNMQPPCDFCCTPMMCPKLLSRPLEAVVCEAEKLSAYKPKFLFIRDENFTMQKDWEQRLAVIHEFMPETKIYLFASANTLKKKDIQFMQKNGVYMVCLGLEDPTKEYSKNKRLDEVVSIMHEYGVMVYLSFIVDPLEIVGREKGKTFYEKLLSRFYDLKPEMVCGNFLMPFRGTALWDKYYAYVAPEDYKYYDSKTPFLIRNPVVREKMRFFLFWYQWKYYTSEFYRQNVREFEVGDTLHFRFLELYQQFRPLYERLRDVRA